MNIRTPFSLKQLNSRPHTPPHPPKPLPSLSLYSSTGMGKIWYELVQTEHWWFGQTQWHSYWGSHHNWSKALDYWFHKIFRERLLLDGRIQGFISWTPYCKRYEYIKKLEIEIDSQELFSLMCNSNINNHPLVMLVYDYRRLLSKFERIKLSKIKRSQNSFADAMAKAGRRSKAPLRTFDRPPPFVIQPYMVDIGNL